MKHESMSCLRRRLVTRVAPLLTLVALASCSAHAQTPTTMTRSSPPVTSRQAPKSSPANTSGWKLVWQDNFEGTGTPPQWYSDTGGYGFGNNQLQWNSSENAQLSAAGGLVITASKGGEKQTCWYGPCEYTGVRIQTRFSQTYGRFEARIKLPGGKGLWPAFWMIPAADVQNQGASPGEIDIIEINNSNPYLVTGYAHGDNAHKYRAADVLDLPVSSQYHIYGVDWTPKGITWTIDGHAYGHFSAYPNWPFDKPFIMILDLAVGGNWPGSPTASTVFPAHMLVSWVRVYKMTSLFPRSSYCAAQQHTD
jgi:beta-glucanase (GH16 family)